MIGVVPFAERLADVERTINAQRERMKALCETRSGLGVLRSEIDFMLSLYQRRESILFHMRGAEAHGAERIR